jgi:BlaI family transcriptional regulator, penicillinase repressor
MRRRKEKNTTRPTDLELSILQVLWKRAAGSVREILHDYNCGRAEEVGYTTILKMLQIMTEKGLVERDDTVRPQVYRASRSQDQTQRQLVSDLLERAFEGSAKRLVMQALSARSASEKDLEQIEQLLDRLEGES